MTGQEQDQTQQQLASEPNNRYQKGSWDWNFDFAYTFVNIANPFHSLIDFRYRSPNPTDYKFATGMLGARYRFTDVGGPWFLRGSAQLCGDIVGTHLISGPETYFIGMAIGMHYDFIQPGWQIVPYMDFRGGPGNIDASLKYQGQQNDLEFTYLWGVGLRYDLNSSMSLSAGALDQHLSDGWIVKKNYSVDSLGVSFRFEKKF